MVFKKVIFITLLLYHFITLPVAAIDYSEIEADRIIFNPRTNVIQTQGHTEIITTEGQTMTLRDAYLADGNVRAGDLTINWDERTRLTAGELERNPPITNARDITFTACLLCDEDPNRVDGWTIHANRFRHDEDRKELTFWNFWLDMYGLPILYLPWMQRPDPTVKYKSGVLEPEFGATDGMGQEFGIPIYFNFSNYHDMTVTPTIFTEENPMVKLEHRLNLDHAEFRTIGSYTYTQAGMHRWHVFHDNVVELGDNTRWVTSINRASDDTYLQRYQFYEDQPFLESTTALEIFGERGYIVTSASIFQELRGPEVAGAAAISAGGDILPRVHGVYQMGLSNGIYSRFMGDMMRVSDLGGDTSINRILGEARIIAPTTFASQRLTFSAAARNDFYQYNNVDDPFAQNTHRFLASGYVDWEMPFVKEGENWTYVIRPRARLTSMSPSDNVSVMNIDSTGALLTDASLFIDNRFTGFDLWVDGTYADYGVSWMGYNMHGQSFEVFIGQTYDFNTTHAIDPNSGFRDGASDYVGRVSISPVEYITFTNRFRLGREVGDLRHNELDVQFGNRNFISVGYIWALQFAEMDDILIRGDSVSEGVIGAGIHFTDRWSFRGNLIYNFTDSVYQRYNAGFFYNHPCWGLEFVYQVDNAMRIVDPTQPELNFMGFRSFRFNFTINMG